MKQDRRKIKVTEKAANCLAWFTGHPMYGDTISEVIVSLTKEWCLREKYYQHHGDWTVLDDSIGMFDDLEKWQKR